tara:strand:+ start:316 stop:474 length:159 start_codon:yes stop_codon:yes gene_type:complete
VSFTGKAGKIEESSALDTWYNVTSCYRWIALNDICSAKAEVPLEAATAQGNK